MTNLIWSDAWVRIYVYDTIVYGPYRNVSEVSLTILSNSLQIRTNILQISTYLVLKFTNL